MTGDSHPSRTPIDWEVLTFVEPDTTGDLSRHLHVELVAKGPAPLQERAALRPGRLDALELALIARSGEHGPRSTLGPERSETYA